MILLKRQNHDSEYFMCFIVYLPRLSAHWVIFKRPCWRSGTWCTYGLLSNQSCSWTPDRVYIRRGDSLLKLFPQNLSIYVCFSHLLLNLYRKISLKSALSRKNTLPKNPKRPLSLLELSGASPNERIVDSIDWKTDCESTLSLDAKRGRKILIENLYSFTHGHYLAWFLANYSGAYYFYKN